MFSQIRKCQRILAVRQGFRRCTEEWGTAANSHSVQITVEYGRLNDWRGVPIIFGRSHVLTSDDEALLNRAQLFGNAAVRRLLILVLHTYANL